MKRRRFLQLFSVIPFLRLPARPDFSTDHGLRLAVESLFDRVIPFSWDLADRKHVVTYAIGTYDESTLDKVRKALYLSIKKNRHRSMMWRSLPVSFNEGGPWVCIMRLVSW